LPRVLAALLLALTFLSGAIIGVAADRALLLKQGRVLPPEAQKASIAEILDQRKERIERIWFDVSPAVRSEIARSNAEIADQLTPLQREEFERIIARWERRVDRMIGPRAP
jgi:type II secretory pathway component PulC